MLATFILPHAGQKHCFVEFDLPEILPLQASDRLAIRPKRIHSDS